LQNTSGIKEDTEVVVPVGYIFRGKHKVYRGRKSSRLRVENSITRSNSYGKVGGYSHRSPSGQRPRRSQTGLNRTIRVVIETTRAVSRIKILKETETRSALVRAESGLDLSNCRNHYLFSSLQGKSKRHRQTSNTNLESTVRQIR
jgi:hypothetical protein